VTHTPHASRYTLDDSFHCAGTVVAFAAHLQSTKIADLEECMQMDTKYRALLRKMTYKDKGSYESSPPCSTLQGLLDTPPSVQRESDKNIEDISLLTI